MNPSQKMAKCNGAKSIKVLSSDGKNIFIHKWPKAIVATLQDPQIM